MLHHAFNSLISKFLYDHFLKHILASFCVFTDWFNTFQRENAVLVDNIKQQILLNWDRDVHLILRKQWLAFSSVSMVSFLGSMGGTNCMRNKEGLFTQNHLETAILKNPSAQVTNFVETYLSCGKADCVQSPRSREGWNA